MNPRPNLFEIKIGQVWKRGGSYWHIPIQEIELPPHTYQVIRCEKKVGWVWIFPRNKNDEPIWTLKDFQHAELIE